MSEQTKGVKFDYKSIKNTTVTFKEDEYGGKTIAAFSFTQEAIPALLDAIAALEGNERGVKLSFHIRDKDYQGKTFKSSSLWVDAIQEPRAYGGGETKRTFRNAFPKKAVSTESVAAARASVSNGVSRPGVAGVTKRVE